MAKGKLLLVNACINRGTSRTLRLARRVAAAYPDYDTEELVLEDMNLRPADSDFVNRRTELAESGSFDDPIFDTAKKFASADVIIIATPYWEDCFNSMTKIFMEHSAVVGLTFRYDETGRPVGMCQASVLYYVTTRGGYVSDEEDLGYAVYRRLSSTYGIPSCKIISAEGLDIFGNDAEKIMAEAFTKADSIVRG